MSYRPFDWTPLAETDPLPGEPEEIQREAARLRNLGVEMRSQIANLRLVAEQSTMVGRSADALRAAAGELVVGLEKAVGRQEKTAKALDDWHGDLAGFQRATLTALATAHESARMRARAEALLASAASAPGDLMDGSLEYQKALAQADELLADAREALTKTLGIHRERDRHIARLIDDATDDEAEDGRWDNFKDWVDRNKGWLDGWTEALGWVATIAAVAALAVPGVNVAAAGYLASVAVGATAASAAGHGALMSAGHASKVDLALDVFALATFGAGRVVASGLKSAQAATRTAAASAAREAARDASLRASRNTREAAGRVLTDSRASAGARRGARDRIDYAHAQAQRAGTEAAHEVRHAALAPATPKQQLISGTPADADHVKDIRGLSAAFAGDAEVAQAAAKTDRLFIAGAASFHLGLGSDVADRSFDDLGGVEPYRKFKRQFSHEVGSTW